MVFVIKSNINNPQSFQNNVESVSSRNDFFSLILKNKYLSGYSVTFDDNEYDINSLFKLIVNVKYIGKFFFFYNPRMEIEQIVDKAKELSNIDSIEKEKAFEKVKQLIDIAFNKYLLFTIFYGCDEGHDINELLTSIYKDKYTQLYIIKQKYIDEDIVRNKTIKQLLRINKYRWLSILISGISMYSFLLFGIVNIYYDNLLPSVLLLITSLLSLIGLSIANYDLYRRETSNIKLKELSLCLSFDIISFLIGCGMFLTIFQLIKDEDVAIPLVGLLFTSIVTLLFFLSLVLFLSWNINHKHTKDATMVE